jgi:small conductance mechanosensitive channel
MDWTPVLDWLKEYGWKVLLIIIIAVVGHYLLRRLIRPILAKTMPRRMQGRPEEEIEQRVNTLNRIVIQLSGLTILIVTILTILSQVGVSITPILAGLGIVGIAVGFGAQTLVKDIISGFFVFFEDQYGIGDVAQVAGITGLVEDITLRRTILRDLDGIVHSVPNGEIRVASNYTKDWSRVNLNIGVGYGEDLDHVIEVINRVGKELAEDPNWSPLMLTAPQVLRVDALGDSGIDIKILGETKPIQQWAVMGELRKRLKRVFDEEGIEIPWPHTKVYFGNPLEQQRARIVEYKPAKREEVPEKHEAEHEEETLPPPSQFEVLHEEETLPNFLKEKGMSAFLVPP